MALRRKIALMICPELADLPHDAMNALPPAKNAKAASDAERICRLDRLYTAATGVVLTASTAPEYTGPMYEWRSSRTQIRHKVISLLGNLRARRQGGVHMTSAHVAIHYFAAIWPNDLKWPADIPRPTPKKEAA